MPRPAPKKPKPPRKPRPSERRAHKAAVRALNAWGELTERDLRVLEWVTRHVVSLGYPPSVREIMRAFRIRFLKVVVDTLGRLEAYGFIDVDAGVARGIRVHNLPEPGDLAGARLKLWVCEAAGLLRRHAPADDPDVDAWLKKASVIAF